MVRRRYGIFFVFTVTIILSCVAIMLYYSGVEHEPQNVKNIFLSILIVLGFQILFSEPLKLLIMAIDMFFWPPTMFNYKKLRKETEDDDDYNQLNFLKQRLKSLREGMLITERYRNEPLNWEYKTITNDLITNAKYFIVLVCAVLISRDPLTYYNTERTQFLLMNNHSGYIGLKEVYHLSQLFDFVESSLVDAFNFDPTGTGRYSWIHAEQVRMMGVVRLRQLRLEVEQMGWGYPKYTEKMYMPDWQLPHYGMHYSNKYWRIYDPWLPFVEKDFVSKILLNFDHVGKFQYYPELKGYVALLARSRINSMKILEFLTETHWLTYNTSVVFMDFTLYNADAELFSVCTLRVEQTPFGGIIPDTSCDSVHLINDALQMPYLTLVVIIIYSIVILQFTQTFLENVWYEPSKLIKGTWQKVDLVIVLLNIAMFVVTLMRAAMISKMLKRLEGANKLEFLDFRKPTRLEFLNDIVAGFLISLTTLRMWKVLQFAKVFQLFNNTLYRAWTALAITACAIFIFLIAFGIAFIIINGKNSPHFVQPIKSVVTTLCFAFGFSDQLHPSDLFYGGEYLGIIMYAVLGFVVSVLLVNVFMTLVHDFFSIARKEADAKFERQITFCQFLRVHYYRYFNFFYSLPCFKKPYRGLGHTVAENIQIALKKREARWDRNETKRSRTNFQRAAKQQSEETLQTDYRERIEVTYSISTILNTQMEILERLLFDDDTYKNMNRKTNATRWYKRKKKVVSIV